MRNPNRTGGPAKAATRSAEPLAVETKLFRGLADASRLRILLELRAGPRAAGDLASGLGLTPSATSNHLLCLLECGLLSVESSGRRNLYRLADPAVEGLLDASRVLLGEIAPTIEACLNYGPPSRRALRPRTTLSAAPPSAEPATPSTPVRRASPRRRPAGAVPARTRQR